MDHSGTEVRCSDARCSHRRRHGLQGSSTSRRSRYSGQMDLTCGRDHGRRKVGMADLEFLDLESLAGMVDPVSRQDLVSPGPGLSALCLRSVAARKA